MEPTDLTQASGLTETSTALGQEVRQARRCFMMLERLSGLMASYPPGHPMVEQAAANARAAFYEFFELNDRLSVLVDAHSMKLLGTDEVVWQTQEPRDYCWALSRDGIYLMHVLAGIETGEIRRLVEIFIELVDERNLAQDAVSILFQANLRHVSYDAIDESLAHLAGLDVDIRDRDTREEQELIEELFEQCFEQTPAPASTVGAGDDLPQQNFQIRMEHRQARQTRMQVGSREFLRLSEESRQHLLELRRGFREHAELEHREGEVLAAILGAQPKDHLRRQAVDQIGEVMGSLLETNQPWEALAFLKLIHHWRDRFDSRVVEELKHVVAQCFTPRRLGALVKMIAIADQDVRRAILQMFNALHLDHATAELAKMLAWELDEEVEQDVVRYLRERARYSLDFVEEAIFEVPPDRAAPLIEILQAHMNRARPILLELVRKPIEPQLKAFALRSLAGSWSSEEVETYLVPLLDASHQAVRLNALRGLADAAPEKLTEHIGPLFGSELASREHDEVRELASLYLQYGGFQAVRTIRELIQVRGPMVGEAEKDLAVVLAKILARTPNPQVGKILAEIGKDWLVPSKIRTTCKELAQLLNRGASSS